GLSGAGLALLAGCGSRSRPAGPVGPEPPVETTRLRLAKRDNPSICNAPYWLAEEFLPAEGFTDVSWTRIVGDVALPTKAVVSGEADMHMTFSAPLIMRMDEGDQFVILAGVHPGCFELVATERVRSIRDLKGKTVAANELAGPQHVFLSSMAAYVGLD